MACMLAGLLTDGAVRRTLYGLLYPLELASVVTTTIDSRTNSHSGEAFPKPALCSQRLRYQISLSLKEL